MVTLGGMIIAECVTPGESRFHVGQKRAWIPAFAGMTCVGEPRGIWILAFAEWQGREDFFESLD
jgi:hypothetical protein